MTTNIPPESMTTERDQRLIDHERRREAAERFGEAWPGVVYTRQELADILRNNAVRWRQDGYHNSASVLQQAADLLAKDDAEYFKGRAEG